LHCERFVKRRIVFCGHRLLAFRLHDGIVARRNRFIPEEYFISFVASRREYSDSVAASRNGTPAVRTPTPEPCAAGDNSQVMS
jgi:hypothetical protein